MGTRFPLFRMKSRLKVGFFVEINNDFRFQKVFSSMKKTLLILLIGLPFTILSQNQFGVKGGINSSNLMPMRFTYGSINPHIGFYYSINQSDKWVIQPEIQISQNNFFSEDFDDIHLTYINLPFIIKYYARQKLNFHLGLQYGTLVEADATNSNNLPFIGVINPSDFSAIIGVGYDLLGHIHIEGRLIPEVSRLMWSEGIPHYRKMTVQLSLNIPISLSKLKESVNAKDWDIEESN